MTVDPSSPADRRPHATECTETASFAAARQRFEAHARIWRDRPLTRRVYAGYYRTILHHLSDVEGLSVEYGSGHGAFAEYAGGRVTSSDVVSCPWLDGTADATDPPFDDGTLANIVLIDVLHHIAEPQAFFEQAARTLAPGGRLVMVEPYVSPLSWMAWRFLHEEHIDTTVDPFARQESLGEEDAHDPWDSNIAIPTLAFFRKQANFSRRFPSLRVLVRKRMDWLVMPLSGGFERRRFLPWMLVPLAEFIERLGAFMLPLAAFRCLVVVERT